MAKKSIRIETIPTNCPKGRILRTEVSYDLGGPNYFSGGQTQRGYHLHAQLYKTEGSWESSNPMEGFRAFVEAAPRFNAKRMEMLSKTIRNNPIYKQVVDATLTKAALQRVSFKHALLHVVEPDALAMAAGSGKSTIMAATHTPVPPEKVDPEFESDLG